MHSIHCQYVIWICGLLLSIWQRVQKLALSSNMTSKALKEQHSSCCRSLHFAAMTTFEHLKVFTLCASLFIYIICQLWGQRAPWQKSVSLNLVDKCLNSSLELPLYYTDRAGNISLENPFSILKSTLLVFQRAPYPHTVWGFTNHTQCAISVKETCIKKDARGNMVVVWSIQVINIVSVF